MGLERQLVALLGLLADREQADGRVRAVEDQLGEDRAHVAELEQVLGAVVGVRPTVEQHRHAVAQRDRDGDRRPLDARQAPEVEQPGGEHRAGVPGRDDRVGVAVRHAPDRGDEARVRLRADCLGGLVGHVDPVGRLDEREALGVEPGGAVQDDVDAVG